MSHVIGTRITMRAGILPLLAATALFSLQGRDRWQVPAAPVTGITLQTQAKRGVTGKVAYRKIPCKMPENATLCYWTHGRLRVYNGNPSDRIWQIGTRRLLGVFNGPSHFPPRTIADDESPELPMNLERAYEADYRKWKQSKADTDYEFPTIFADFEVCPLEPEKKGGMQAVCVESAENIFAQQFY
jgi:hypothetical protein